MLNVAQADRRTGRDWPYSDKEMQQTTAQRDYPTTGRSQGRRRQAA